jgi:glucoamylase
VRSRRQASPPTRPPPVPQLTSNWQAWSGTCKLPPSSASDLADLADALRQSATVLRVHQDCVSYPGAIVAGLCTPWGDTTNNAGGYHLVWPRDAVEVGFALTLLGHLDDAAQLLDYLATRQSSAGFSASVGSLRRGLPWSGCQVPKWM